MNPFFNPGPIDYPHPQIHLAAVNPYMAHLAGELCDGLRLHPIATFRYTREVVVPSLEAGAEASGRKLADLDLIGAPFLAVAKTEEGVEAAKRALKQHIAFYASTRTYHSVLKFHGWLDVGNSLHQMSREGRWKEMPGQISDEMLEEWAIVGTCDEFVAKLKERCSDIFSTVLLDLAPQLRCDEAWVAETVDALHRD